jgi:uncharacterized protein (TIGR02284 family)
MTKDIEVLNDVTKTLIDSQKGYETCIDVADDSYALQANFRNRAQRRSELVRDFQSQVRNLGGEPTDSGSAAGTAHRAWASFSSLFVNDEKAAVEAIDDGEDYLADRIENALKENELMPQTQQLLRQAHAQASEGERFADMVENTL